MADSSNTRLDAATAVIFQTTALNAHPSRALAKAVLAAADSAERPAVERLVAALDHASTIMRAARDSASGKLSMTATMLREEAEGIDDLVAEFGQQPTGDEQ